MPSPKNIFDTMMEKDFFSQWLKLEPISIEAGSCEIKMTVRREMLNGYGILHGGVAYAFADSAFAFASNSLGRVALSIQGSMNYAKSAKEGDVLIASAKALAITYKTADFDVVISHKESGEKCYFFRGTVYRSSKEF